MEDAGFRVVSSNTDGVEYVCPIERQTEAEMIIYDWELETGMDMEHGTYKALYARDVNNYVAVYDGYTKAKGVYAEPTIAKNSEYPIVFEAIRLYLLDGVPLEHTITECKDIRRFLTSRTVRGGAVWGMSRDIKDTEEYTQYVKDAMDGYGGFGSGRASKDEDIERRNKEYQHRK